MTTSPSSLPPHRRGLKTSHAIVIILLAVSAWGVVWWWQAQQTPSPVETHLEAGLKFFQAGQLEQAENQWLKALELDPKNVIAWEALGDYYLATKQWQPSLKAYAVVAKMHPDSPHLWTKMARIQALTGNAEGARHHVEEALKRDPDDVEALNILTTLLKRAGEDAQRVEILQRLAKLKPNDATILNKTADALMVRKRYKDAEPLIEQLLKINPDSSSGYAMRGALAYNQDASPSSLKKAVADFEKAIALNDANWVARWYLGRSYLRLNQPAQAIQELKRVDEMRPADKNYLNDLAAAYQRSGLPKQATAVRARYAAAERQDHAIKELRSRLAAAPHDFETNLQLGQLLLQSKNPDGAGELIAKAVKLQPKNEKAQGAMQNVETDYQRNLKQGLEFLKAKKISPAVLHLSRALLLRPQDERTRKAVEQLAAATGLDFYQTVFELERLAQS